MPAAGVNGCSGPERAGRRSYIPGVPIGVLVGLVPGLLTCIVTEIYCHRALAHRAFRVHPALARVLDAFMQVYGGVHPQRWVGVHRLHHRYAD